jgi:tetratricopeptide (TPR) repeat protein
MKLKPHQHLGIAITISMVISTGLNSHQAFGQTKESNSPENKPKEISGRQARTYRNPLIIITHKATNLLLTEIQKEKQRKEPRQQVIFYYNQRILMFSHRMDEAKKNIAAKLITNPNWSLLYLLQAEIAELEFREEDQIRYLKKALEVDPVCVSAADSLSRYYCETGHIQEAADLLKRTLSYISPEKSASRIETLKNLSRVQLYLADTAGAEASLKEIIEMSPDDELCVLYLVKIYAKQGRWKEVYELADGRLHRKDGNILFLYHRANASFNLGDFKNAEKDVTEFLKLLSQQRRIYLDISTSKDNQDARRLRAKIYEKTGRKAMAKAELEKLKSTQKETYDSMLFRGKERN